MSRQALESPFRYTRAAVTTLTGASPTRVARVGRAVLKKRGRGTGNYIGHDFDDLLRIRIARELLDCGVQVASIHGIFAAIEPHWAWLRTDEARRDGAALVLITGSLGLNSTTGRAYLTNGTDAVAWLKSKTTVVVMDVGAMIDELEAKTGERYA